MSTIKQLDKLIQETQGEISMGTAIMAPIMLDKIAESADDWDAVRVYIKQNSNENTERLLAGFAKACTRYNLNVGDQNKHATERREAQYVEDTNEDSGLSVGKQAAMVGAAAALGLGLGLRHDPNKRFSLFKKK